VRTSENFNWTNFGEFFFYAVREWAKKEGQGVVAGALENALNFGLPYLY
jgi:hypothetical protein